MRAKKPAIENNITERLDDRTAGQDVTPAWASPANSRPENHIRAIILQLWLQGVPSAENYSQVEGVCGLQNSLSRLLAVLFLSSLLPVAEGWAQPCLILRTRRAQVPLL